MTTSLRRESAMRFAEGGARSVAEIPAPSAGAPSPDQASSYRRATLSLVALTTSVFISSMTIGLPLPIIGAFRTRVDEDMGLGGAFGGAIDYRPAGAAQDQRTVRCHGDAFRLVRIGGDDEPGLGRRGCD